MLYDLAIHILSIINTLNYVFEQKTLKYSSTSSLEFLIKVFKDSSLIVVKTSDNERFIVTASCVLGVVPEFKSREKPEGNVKDSREKPEGNVKGPIRLEGEVACVVVVDAVRLLASFVSIEFVSTTDDDPSKRVTNA